MHLETGETVLPLKRIKSTTISLSIFCFGILYFIYYFRKTYLVADNPFILNTLDLVEWPIYVFMFLNAIIKAKYKIRDLVLIFGVGCIFLLGYASTGYAELLKAMMIIVVLKDVDYRELFDVMYRILVFSIALTVMLYLLGLSDAGVQRRDANALGYAQANSVGYVLMVLTLLTIVKKDEVSSWNKILLVLLNLAGFIIADSRTGFFLTCFALLFANNRIYVIIKRNWLIQTILTILPVILMIATIRTAVLYESNAFVQVLDVLFSARIAMNNYLLTHDGITLLGQPTEYHGYTAEAIYNPVTESWSHFMTIDSAYMDLIIEFGLLATVVIGITYFKLMRKLFKYDAVSIAFAMTIISLYGLTESAIISIYVAFPFLLLLNEKIKIRKTNVCVEYDT